MTTLKTLFRRALDRGHFGAAAPALTAPALPAPPAARHALRRRGAASRKILLATVVALVIGGGAVAGVAWWRANSPGQLAARAQLAMGQRDYDSAVKFLSKALDKNPSGDAAVRIRALLGKAMIEAGRESDARAHLSAALAASPDDAEAIALTAESYARAPGRRYGAAPRPLTPQVAADLAAAIDAGLADLAKLPAPIAGSAAAHTAEAQLHRLYFALHQEQLRHASAIAEAKADPVAARAAAERVAALEKSGHRDRQAQAYAALDQALAKDPKNTRAAELAARFHLDDAQSNARDNADQAAHFAGVLKVYEALKAQNVRTQELTILAADAVLTDTRATPRGADRSARAKAVLEDFLAAEPKNVRALVALGQVQLDAGDAPAAEATVARALALSPDDLSAQLLSANTKWRRDQLPEASALLTKMTSAHGNVAKVWTMRGLVSHDLGNHKAAEEDLRRALSLAPSFVPARRGLLLVYQAQARHQDAAAAKGAAALAGQLIHDDRYFMPAWRTHAETLRRDGKQDEALKALAALAADPNLPADARADLVLILVDVAIADRRQGHDGAPAIAVAEALAATIKADPNDPTTLFIRARLATARNDAVAARQALAAAVAARPEDPSLRLAYAEALRNTGLPADARVHLDAAAKGDLSREQALGLARGYLDLHLPSEALAATDRVLKTDPKNPKAVTLAARATGMLENQPVVPASINPETASINDTLRAAALALESKQPQEALRYARAAAARDAASIPARALEATALFALNQVDEATTTLAAAAKLKPADPLPYRALVDLFANAPAGAADAAAGIAHAGKFSAHNAAMAEWAKGRLAALANRPADAARHFEDGLRAANTSPDPQAAREHLFTGVERLASEQEDGPGYARTIDRLAATDASLAPILRLAAANHFLVLGDAAASRDQLARIDTKAAADLPRPLAIVHALRWGAAGDAAKGLAALNAHPEKDAPETRDAAAALHQQAGELDLAIKIREDLAKRDAANPNAWIALAQTHLAAGDMPAALAALKTAEGLGQSGAINASAARVRLFTAMGLLQAASDALAASAIQTRNDPSARLALGQAYAALRRPDEARPILEAIAPHAPQYPAAQITLANLAADAGDNDRAVSILRALADRLGKDRPTPASIPLTQALVRAGKAPEAFAYAKAMRDRTLVKSPAYNTWTLLAASAAREARDYAAAADLLLAVRQRLSPAAVATDLTLLRLLQNKPDPEAAAALADTAPAFDTTTHALLTAAAPDAAAAALPKGFTEQAAPGSVLALLAATPPAQWNDTIAGPLAKATMFRGDLTVLAKELAGKPNATETLKKLALAQRLLEAGWSTAALDVLDAAKADDVTHAGVIRQQALVALRRTKEADALRADLAKRAPEAASPRYLTALALLAEEKFDEAHAAADALAKAEPPRADLLTLLGQIEERRNRLDAAIAHHRDIRARFPEYVPAANNLAYTLAQRSLDTALPANKRADLLAEARKEIEWATARQPGAVALNDTRGWIDILSDTPAATRAGVTRLAKAAPFLPLEPAVHYHLGVGYAKLGQQDLARLHLQNVQTLAAKRTGVPEVPLAIEQLKTLAAP